MASLWSRRTDAVDLDADSSAGYGLTLIMEARMGLLDDIEHKLKDMGRQAIADAHAFDLPAVYKRDHEIVWEYPGGELIDDEDHHRRRAAEGPVDDSPEKADFRRRIGNRYELLTGRRAP